MCVVVVMGVCLWKLCSHSVYNSGNRKPGSLTPGPARSTHHPGHMASLQAGAKLFSPQDLMEKMLKKDKKYEAVGDHLAHQGSKASRGKESETEL